MRRANGGWARQRAVLDLRVEAPPDAPVTYLNVKVTHPCSATYVAGAAEENGFAAQKAEDEKHARYPANTQGSPAALCRWWWKPMGAGGRKAFAS